MTQFDARDYGVSVAASDNGPALMAACAAASAVRGLVQLPSESVWVRSPIVVEDVHRLTITGHGRLLFTASGGLHVKSGQRITLADVSLYATEPRTTPILQTGLSSGWALDAAYLTLERCDIEGSGTGTGLALDRAVCVSVRDTRFTKLSVGIHGVGASYSNAVTVDRCVFSELLEAAIVNPGQGWSISGGTFEPRPDGTAGGIRCDVPAYGLTIAGGWFGDVRTNGGGPWLRLLAIGATVTGNYIVMPTGPGATPAIELAGGSQGVHIAGNRIDGTPAIACVGAPYSWGVAMIGNDMQGGVSGRTQLQSFRAIGNHGLADT